MKPRCALIMAGGTGGHIFPGLAVAEALRDAGWRVHWLGAPASMEEQLVPRRGFAFEAVQFGGVRGKGLQTLALLPLKLLRAFWQSLQVVRRVQPDVVVGLGGYITFPGGMMASLLGKPLVLHEQNSVAGLANKVLARVAERVFTAFPNVLSGAAFVGNPLRSGFTQQAEPAQRFADRSGPLRSMAPIDQAFTKLLNDVVLLLVGSISTLIGMFAINKGAKSLVERMNPTPPMQPMCQPMGFNGSQGGFNQFYAPPQSSYGLPSQPFGAMPVWKNPELDESWTPPPPPTTPPDLLEDDDEREQLAQARKEAD